jgi:hypothetical protein
METIVEILVLKKKLISYYVAGGADGESGLPLQVRNPPRSVIKGRKKERRCKKGMSGNTKRKIKCSKCEVYIT